MELVLNKCYGGYGLSHAAKMKILEKKGIAVFLYMQVESDDIFEQTLKRISEKEVISEDRAWRRCIYYFQIDPCKNEFVNDEYCMDYKDFDFDSVERFDKELVETVRSLKINLVINFQILR